ncbi:DMT family transporter [Brevibacterium salitolerans]|uniref:EamA family transporter n=1 Tax=Brevibacterium salitolerans TaxID=1403566 RepID=A0ABN2X2U2_9MICO
MSAAVLCMVLTAAVLHAVWNIAAKRADGSGALFVWAYQAAGAVLLTGPAAVLLLRDPEALTPRVLAAAVVTALLHIGYGVSLQKGYAQGDLSVVYPVARGTGPALTLLIAVAVLGERPGVWAAAGAVGIVAGIVIVTLQGRSSVSGSPDPATLRRGLLWGLLTGAFIAGYTLWDDHVVGAGEVSPVLYFWLCSALQALLLGPVAVRRRSELRGLLTRRWGTVLTVGVLSPAAYILVLFAMQQAPVSLIAPLRETSVVIGLVLARILFGERGLASRLAGAALVVAGVALIAAG